MEVIEGCKLSNSCFVDGVDTVFLFFSFSFKQTDMGGKEGC